MKGEQSTGTGDQSIAELSRGLPLSAENAARIADFMAVTGALAAGSRSDDLSANTSFDVGVGPKPS